MASGIIKFFDNSKGFGFIQPDAGGADTFVESSALPSGINSLKVGQRIHFDIKKRPRGM